MIDPVMSVPITVLMFFVLLVLGVHIGVALGIAGLTGMLMSYGVGMTLAQLIGIPFSITYSFSLAVIPMFVLLGSLAERAGITTELYHAANIWLRHLRGGLAMATIAAGAAFGAACGSTVVSAAIFTKISLPEMVKFGYDKRTAAGCIAAAGTLASLIPPSILFVVYGVITEESIGKLLISGILPGILSAIMFIICVQVLSRWKKTSHLIPKNSPQRASLKERLVSLREVWGMLILFIIVMGGIYTGWATATHSGALGALGALILVTTRGRLSFAGILDALRDAVQTTSVIFIIVVGGFLFARFMTFTGLLTDLCQWALALNISRYVYLAIFVAVFLIMGCFVDAVACMLLILPAMFPLMTGVGFHPIWLGVISIKLAEIGLVTPPVGLNVYVVKSSSPIPIDLVGVFAGVTPFVLTDLCTLAILIAIPEISLYLPELMF
jgi:C4-dicarboxylate transporter DctM subunit